MAFVFIVVVTLAAMVGQKLIERKAQGFWPTLVVPTVWVACLCAVKVYAVGSLSVRDYAVGLVAAVLLVLWAKAKRTVV